MPDRIDLPPMPASREPVSLLSVDRAASEIRRGRMVAMRGAGGTSILIQAAEAVTPEGLENMMATSRTRPALAITARRAMVLRLVENATCAVRLSMDGDLNADLILDLADPLRTPPADLSGFQVSDVPPFACDGAAVGLAKLARLLPAAVTAEIADPGADDLPAWTARHDLQLVDAGDVFQYEQTAARTLRPVSEAKVPLFDAEDARIVAFRPGDGGLEHLAIIIGDPRADDPVLTRLHSECFTGDLLGSLRCDCGEQLRGAIKQISEAGNGILLYLAQEGRGIGLANKLRAYELQDQGFDTMDANEQLGFDADERVYLVAARMLRELKFKRVRLMTNNPDKVAALSRCGITVETRVPLAFPANEHNEFYLRTKVLKGGHLF